MSPDLVWYFVRPLIKKHPLPWTAEQDWTIEVTDSKGHVVIKLMSFAHAEELIKIAGEVATYDAEGAAEAKKFLAEAGIDA